MTKCEEIRKAFKAATASYIERGDLQEAIAAFETGIGAVAPMLKSIKRSPRYSETLKGFERVLEIGSLSRRSELDDSVEQFDGMPSYPKVYESTSGDFIAVCER